MSRMKNAAAHSSPRDQSIDVLANTHTQGSDKKTQCKTLNLAPQWLINYMQVHNPGTVDHFTTIRL